MAGENFVITPDGQNYASKMDQALKDMVSAWWDNLTKEEILTYLLEQPSITADHLRNMLANEQCLMNFEVRFSVAGRDATANFHTSAD
ncbi:MAG: hypothetical protein NC489_30190 [Ruminococcus flavefaciens]|nr:hypothetical protein [Ruminococcus flavefaciens]